MVRELFDGVDHTLRGDVGQIGVLAGQCHFQIVVVVAHAHRVVRKEVFFGGRSVRIRIRVRDCTQIFRNNSSSCIGGSIVLIVCLLNYWLAFLGKEFRRQVQAAGSFVRCVSVSVFASVSIGQRESKHRIGPDERSINKKNAGTNIVMIENTSY